MLRAKVLELQASDSRIYVGAKFMSLALARDRPDVSLAVGVEPMGKVIPHGEALFLNELAFLNFGLPLAQQAFGVPFGAVGRQPLPSGYACRLDPEDRRSGCPRGCRQTKELMVNCCGECESVGWRI